MDVPHYFGLVPEGCDVPGWVPFLSADELGMDRPKLMIMWATGEVVVSEPKSEIAAAAD